MRRSVLAASVLVLATATWPASASEPRGTASGFELVGHNPLYARGMNAAPAFFDHYVYIGNRTDGSPEHPHPGVLVVDVANPSAPRVVGEIGPPHVANPGETSRELRVWPDQGLLLVMNFGCSSLIHACAGGEAQDWNIKFFDVAANPVSPPLVATYVPSRMPHEMFLWLDPKRPGRALLYMSTPTSSTTRPNLIVADISRARSGQFTEVATWIGTDRFSAQDRERYDVRLHSMSVSADGRRTYLAFLGGGFLILDTSDLARAVERPEIRLVTRMETHPSWGNPGAHSAIRIPGRDLVLMSDEVYGDFLDPITGDDHGCPWGWVRMIDAASEAVPKVISEYRVEQNTPDYCRSADGRDPSNTTWTSYAAHNPTVLPRLAFVTWHSAGLHAISLANPTRPSRAGVFTPVPLPSVATEDPALSAGRNKVVMWSFPIIIDGLIYVVDIRNGLYILRYTGPGAEEVSRIRFLEGNSNLGDALRLDTVCRRGKADDHQVAGTRGADLLGGTAGRDAVCGFGGDDRVRGHRGGDLLVTGGGDDRVTGGPGSDRVIAGPGKDVLRGGPGRDVLVGGPGKEVCVGGPGVDRLVRCGKGR